MALITTKQRNVTVKPLAHAEQLNQTGSLIPAIGGTARAFRRVALLLAVVLCAPVGLAETFRWVDESGNVHYTDQVPPEVAKRPRAKVNPEGKIKEVFEGQKTPEQLEALKRLKRLRTDQQRILVEQRDSDVSLNRTYRSEEELQVALKGKLNTIDAAKKIADSNRLHQEEILRSLIKRAADTENTGQPVPQLLRDSIESTRKQIASYQEKARALDNTKGDFVANFTKDLERFKNLEAMQRNPEYGSLEWQAQRPEADVPIVSAIACTLKQCDAAWTLAKNYLKTKSSRPIVTETPTILQTAGPRTERDMALLVVRIPGKTADTLFLDTSCHISSIGDELCSGTIARDIRVGFVPFLEANLKPEH
jgi:hypothetical protein